MIFTIDAPHVEHASIAEAAEAGPDQDEATAALAGGKSLWDRPGLQGKPG